MLLFIYNCYYLYTIVIIRVTKNFIKMNLNIKNKKNLKCVKCINCGFYGHTGKTCNFPVSSYGIICIQITKRNLKYLMIQRKDTLCYTEFIRGKYFIENITYISQLLMRMTKYEKEELLSKSFDKLWNTMWMNNNIKMNKDYEISKKKFIKLSQGFHINTVEGEKTFVSLKILIDNSVSCFSECEWEFPKGRRKLNESDLICACREFEEETAVPISDIIIKNDIKQHETVFKGSNKIRYRNVYFIATYNSKNKQIRVDRNNTNQIKEVRDVKWFTDSEVFDKMKNEPIEKIELFQRINNMLQKKYNIN